MPRCNGLSRRLMAALVLFAVSTEPCVLAMGVAAADPSLMPARFTQIVTDDGRVNVRRQRDHPDAEKPCAPSQCAADFGGTDSKPGGYRP